MDELIELGTANPSDRCWKWCRCDNCGIEAQCTPKFDFYGENGDPLLCERCFMNRLRDEHNIQQVEMIHSTP